jgi:hypothetical protein
MVAGDGIGMHGVPSFHVHPSHAFEGFELVERAGSPPLLLARCECGDVLDIADARFAACPGCDRRDRSCGRCGGTGRVVDHAALEWRAPPNCSD